MEDYQKKYIKYKTKFLQLKSLEVNKQINIPTLLGGGYFHEKNQSKSTGKLAFKPCTLKIIINDNSPIYSYLQNNLQKFNFVNSRPLSSPLHMSLLQFEINMDHPLNKIGQSTNQNNNFAYKTPSNTKELTNKFKTFISGIYLKFNFIEIFYNTEFETSRYTILGRDNKFLVQEFDYNLNVSNDRPQITNFRVYFYNKLLEYIKSIDSLITNYTRREETIQNIKYTLLFYGSNPEPLFAIPDYYWGDGVWTPHVSLLQLDNLPSESDIQTKISDTKYKKIKFVYDNNNINDVVLE